MFDNWWSEALCKKKTIGDLRSPSGFGIKSRMPEDEEQLDDTLDQVQLLWLFTSFCLLH